MARILINDKFVFSIIVINALAIFLNAFPEISKASKGILFWIDYACAIFFIVELLLKVQNYSFKGYWDSGWNRFDFFVVLASSPVLLSPVFDLKTFSVLLILRLSRISRLIKLLRFIPNRDSLLQGTIRALKASIGVFMALAFLIFLFSMGATLLFGTDSPEYFGNPLISFYSLFKVFTVEGWYEIPDSLATQTESSFGAFFIRFYFIVCVLAGGILGLSLANAVFVDEMTADNTAKAERLILELKEEIKSLRKDLNRMNSS